MPDRHARRRPFAWMKRLANLKPSSTSPQRESKKLQAQHGANATGCASTKPKSSHFHHLRPKNNGPYPESGHLQGPPNPNGPPSLAAGALSDATSYASSYEDSNANMHAPVQSNKSNAPTLATHPGTIHSDAGFSKAGTTVTTGGGQSSHDGRNSTFSSPNHSEHSLTTTLTTIQSAAPSNLFIGPQNTPMPAASHNLANGTGSVAFLAHSPPASALPPHVQSSLQPHTYTAATANNILTDNASILTLASSSKRRRRHSLDTDASVRALAPSSLFGASRESLPLSVLSGTMGYEPGRPSMSVLASAERASVYSSSGVAAPALSSERNSYYADKTKSISSAAGIPGMSGLRDVVGGETGSMRSGFLGHGKTDSISGISVSSPLASPREASINGKLSRKGSDWTKGDVEEDGDGEMKSEVGTVGTHYEVDSDDSEAESTPYKGKGPILGGDGGKRD